MSIETEIIIGWDIGGAHLKAVTLDKKGQVVRAIQLPCPLWQGLQHLEVAIDKILCGKTVAQHAVTMTGELVDLFANRSEGVEKIIELIQRKTSGSELHIFAGEKGFIKPSECRDHIENVASMNWHATAQFVAGKIEQGLLVDIGSTTTDIILLRDDQVHAQGKDDFQRMVNDELVYTGIVRTPLMALAQKVFFEGVEVGMMAEHFATTADIYRITGELDEASDQHAAADNGAKNIQASIRRLARMIGRDVESAPPNAWKTFAQNLINIQLNQILISCKKQLTRNKLAVDAPIIGAGAGSFLAKKIAEKLHRPYVDFSRLVDADESKLSSVKICAPAYAVAELFRRKNADSKLASRMRSHNEI